MTTTKKHDSRHRGSGTSELLVEGGRLREGDVLRILQRTLRDRARSGSSRLGAAALRLVLRGGEGTVD